MTDSTMTKTRDDAIEILHRYTKPEPDPGTPLVSKQAGGRNLVC